MQKNKHNVRASKLRPVKTFKGGKCYFTGEGYYIVGNSDTDGRAIIINIFLLRLLYGS